MIKADDRPVRSSSYAENLATIYVIPDKTFTYTYPFYLFTDADTDQYDLEWADYDMPGWSWSSRPGAYSSHSKERTITGVPTTGYSGHTYYPRIYCWDGI